MQHSEKEVLPPLPSDPDWLIEKGQVLGYRLDKSGVCYGVAIAARNAILAGEFAVFVKRLYLINQYEKYELLDKINDATAVLVEALENTKKNLPLTESSDANKLFQTALNQLNAENQLLLTIRPFFEAVELYQQHYLNPHLFEKSVKFLQNERMVSDLILPLKLVEQGGIDQVGQFSSIYKQKELTQLLSTLSKEFKDETLAASIPLTLSSMDHSITLKFDTGRGWRVDNWGLIDANNLPPGYLPMGEENVLAEKIMRAFSFADPKKKGADVEKFMPFETTIHANKTQSPLISKHIENWLATPEMQDLLAITPAKAKRINSKGASWLTISLHVENEKTALALLETDNAPINRYYENITPLFIAVSLGLPAIVEKFIELKVNVNATNHMESDSLLLFAEMRGLLNPIMMLINNKNEGYTPKDTEEATPLHNAILSGNDEIVRLLLVNNANLTPLFNIEPHELALAFNLNQIADSIADYEKIIKETNDLLKPVYAMLPSHDTKKFESIVENMNKRFLQRNAPDDILASVKEEVDALTKEILATQELKTVGMFAPSSSSKQGDLAASDSNKKDQQEEKRERNKPD